MASTSIPRSQGVRQRKNRFLPAVLLSVALLVVATVLSPVGSGGTWDRSFLQSALARGGLIPQAVTNPRATLSPEVAPAIETVVSLIRPGSVEARSPEALAHFQRVEREQAAILSSLSAKSQVKHEECFTVSHMQRTPKRTDLVSRDSRAIPSCSEYKSGVAGGLACDDPDVRDGQTFNGPQINIRIQIHVPVSSAGTPMISNDVAIAAVSALQ